ncbi:glycosyltransferase group 1 family protein [Prevotella sp. CAG:1058]|nr:glycosyltransferase group 1 family protein [Prevotella sp. CAG:1058]
MLKNILIINDFAYINGGAGKVAINSAIGLSRIGYNVTLFTAVGPIDESLKLTNVRVICLWQKDILSDSNRLRAVRQGIWNEYARKEFEKLLIGLNPQETIVHFHAWIKALSPALFKPIENLKFKLVITLHDYFLFCPNGGLFNYQNLKICNIKASSVGCLLCNCDVRSYPQKIWRYLRQMVQWKFVKSIKNINIIYISKLNREVSYPYLKDISNKWYFVQNPIDINHRAVVDVRNNEKYLFIARLSSEKGIGLFCKAMRDLHLKGCVLGDGYLKDRLQKEYPEIEFKGWVSGKEKDELIMQGKALVFPSLWYEGAPLTIVEMKSYGIPCIVPDKCSASEEIIDGKTGFIFKSGVLTSLEDAIMKYEKVDRNIMQKNIIEDFNPGKYMLVNHCRRLLDVYSDILSGC